MAVEMAATRRRFTRAEYYRMSPQAFPDVELTTTEIFA
jgi:hypothetical protein